MERERRNWLVGMLSRSPFPSLDTYIAGSLLLATLGTASVINTVTNTPELRLLLKEEIANTSTIWFSELENKSVETLSSNIIIQACYYVYSNQPLIWLAMNTYFAQLALLAKLLIHFFCRELSRQEEATVRNCFFSFLLFSTVFLTAIASANQGYLVLTWLIWFGYTGFMSILHQVAFQRFKYIAPASGVTGGRISWMCFSLFVFSYGTFHLLLKYSHLLSTSHFLFLLVDSIISLVRAVHGLLRCLSASERFSCSPDTVRHFNYWLDLVVLLVVDGIQMLNYVHLMIYSPIGFNVTCMFFFYHMKTSYSSIVGTLSRHRKHNQIFQHILSTYPCESAEEGDLCIVCWEGLGMSRKLPCGHQFHEWCLMWWLAQDASCPTCRRVIAAPQQQPIAQQTNNSTTTVRIGGGFGFFRFPQFAIEVSTGNGVFGPLLRRHVAPHDDSQLQGMAQQVREMFPQLSLEVIIEDLRISGSTQATIENILEGRVGFVGMQEEESDDESWHENEEQMASVEEEEVIAHAAGDIGYHEEDHPNKEFAWRRRDMIAKYRRKYIESTKGRDLRSRGIYS